MSHSILIPRPILKAILTELDMCHYIFGPIAQNDILPSDWFRALLIHQPNDTDNIRLEDDDVRKLVIRSITALRGLFLRLRERSDEHLTALRLLHVERGRFDSLLAKNRQRDSTRLVRLATSNDRMERISADIELLNMDPRSMGSQELHGDWLGCEGPSSSNDDQVGYSGHSRAELDAVGIEGVIIDEDLP
ncbi:uncharacterized protein PV06_04529 [Exophiala oligosperma]|uniref:Uncharacterized protein n=2 Tax=Chaetothyriales TaxID=34395 RepID=A0A0D2C142_9EURO|nr:uncharacterized protein PV06_04529 [Exophiala oligosperma]KAJ9637948.1 hypothetical protein H2204_004538 [Knufia peltigerae]KIW43422.1 hypothetical protein PV06_04529 [Exophiala oligosperma]